MESIAFNNINVNKNTRLPNVVDDYSINPTKRVAAVLRQPIRNVDVIVQVLNDDDSVFQSIEGRAISGSISIDANSLTRRTGSITLAVDKAYMPKSGGVAWFNRRFRLYQSITDMSSYPHEPINFLLGTFYITSETLNINLEESNIELTLSDKMSQYDNLTTEERYQIKRGTRIDVAIKAVMEELFHEHHFGKMHESNNREVVQYDYTQEIGTNAMDIITDLRDMYMDYTCGYNAKGEFEFTKVDIQKEDEVKVPKWSFDPDGDDRADLTVSFSENYDFSNVFNRVVVRGAVSSKSNYAPKGEASITDAKQPFNVDAIGMRTKFIRNNNLSDGEQCVAEAKYNLWQTAHFQETCTISCIPVYVLDGKDIIEVTNPVTKEKSKYIIDTINVDLGIGGVMTITAHKLYYTKLAYGDAESPIAKAIKNGINRLGWLSLGEERIKEAYGISGSGDNTITVRLISQFQGGEQAAITGYLTTKVQTLEIDVKDFANLNTASEDGDVGRSSGDYLDRVLAHEMFHAVCNDYYSVDKTQDMPTWFKEGFAELVHGAKERFLSIKFDNVDKQKAYYMRRAEELLNGAWASTSEDYVAAYLLAASIYYLKGGKGMQTMFQDLRTKDNLGLNFLIKLLPIAANNDEVEKQVLQSMRDMPLWGYLNDIKDQDTGSIGGSHMLNLFGTALDAHSVMPNGNATTDSIGFKIQYQE